MWVIRVDMPDNDPCYYDDRMGFVDEKWQGHQYNSHSFACDRALVLSHVYPDYTFTIERYR